MLGEPKKGSGKVRRLGLIITDDLKRTTKEDLADKNIKGHRFGATPVAFTLKDYATPIKDQGDCGSCVAFGSCATFETTKKFADQNKTEVLDLSEADLFATIGTCANGATLEKANARLQSTGVCTEDCWPYGGDALPCANNTRIKILSATRITSDAAAKAAIAAGQAVQFAMDVDDDYFDVDSEAVYSPEYGDYAGGHCQSAVGYDDVRGAWLVKNSWGTSWGFDGYAWVAYGVCGIFRDYAGYVYTVTAIPPVPPVAQTGVHINAGGLNADVLVNGAKVGATDGDIALVAGSYKATIQKDGYVSQDIAFDVLDKQVTTLAVTLQPVAKADINLQAAGQISIAPFGYSNVKYDLILNDKSLGKISKMQLYPKTNIEGKFNNGDGLTFGLKDQKTGEITNLVLVKMYGHDKNLIPNMWLVQMGVKIGGMIRYSISLIVRLLSVSEALVAAKAAMEAAKTIEDLEANACLADELEAACDKRQDNAINARLDAKVAEAKKSKGA
jgi:hypothetical protein